MKFIFLFFVVFAAAQCTSIADTDEAYEAWSTFKAEYAKKYDSDSEENFRKKIFMENKLKIDTHNQKYEKGLVTYSQGINKFSDMLYSEFIATHTGFKYTRPDKLQGATFISPVDPIPPSINWKDKGAVTPVKNQQRCASCWAFTATGSLEGQVFLKKGKLVSLSEQFLVDCSKSNKGCDGGIMHKAYGDIMKIGGVDTEDSYPYEGVDGKCRSNPDNSGATVSNFTILPKNDEKKLTEAIATVGPIAVACYVGQSFQNYKSGVYYDPNCPKGSLNHGVLAAGYGTDKSVGMDYYLAKNSWGADWGENGYIRMARNKDNNCNIAQYTIYPIP